MYQLEERILFDGAAVVAVATAQQDANKNDAAQKQAQDQNADKQNPQDKHDQPNPHTQSSSDITRPNPVGVTQQQHGGVDQLIAQALGLDAAAPAVHKDAAAVEHKVNVMVISTSLENADAVAALADSKTIVIKYDSHTTTSAQLLHEINEALHGEKADSIAFLSEAGNGQLSLFKDGKTTVASLKDSTQQQFWHGVEGMLDAKGRVDFVASGLAATAEGKTLVSEISHITGHEAAASTDLTGSAAKGGDWNLEYVAGGKNAHQTDLTETYLNRNILDSFTSVIPADTMHHEVAFINSTVKDAETIIKQLGSDVDIVKLDSANAFDEIQAYLNTHSNVDSIHIFTHGNEGVFKIGSTTVDNDFLDANKNIFASWGKSLTKEADIMIYGCNTADTAAGKTLIGRLATITGADVAASTDATGRDGNWALEYRVGIIDTSEYLIAGYNYNLAYGDVLLAVTNANDSGTGSLRWAVEQANEIEGVNVIIFSKDVFRTPQSINLTSGEMLITESVVIKGLGSTLITVNGMDHSRVFEVASTATVAISGMTITRGAAFGADNGGAIAVDGTLQLENVEISNSHVVANGGAIYVSNTGVLYTMKVAISDSTAQGFGNGIYSEGTLSLYNSTIAYNGAGGADMYLSRGSAKLFNVTVASTAAGIAVDNTNTATLSMYNTLIYGDVNEGVTPYGGSNNYITQDIAVFVDGALKDNGGWVSTIAIANDSSVVNQGLGYKDGAYQYDSRGYLSNGANDIGAFEYNGYVARNASATSNAYYSSVAEAVAGAVTGDKIELVDTRIKLDSEIIIAKDITLYGTDQWTTVLSRGADSNSRAFTIGTSGVRPAVNMLNFAIRDGSELIDNGGAILNYGNLQLRNMLIADNMAVSGGAVYNRIGAFLYAVRSSFVNNTASADGGAIYNLGSATVETSQLSGNTAGVSGGGIYNGTYGRVNGQLFLLSSTVDNNTAASGAGGGIYTNGKFQAETSTIFQNSAFTLGGGIYTEGASKLISLTVANNAAISAGGGIYIKGGVVNLANTIAVYNTESGSWSDVRDPNNILSSRQSSNIANFIGENVSGFYAYATPLFDGSLKDNGGWTYTLALNTGSKFFSQIRGQGINIGNKFDQRGYMINYNGRDIGAYEYDGYVGWLYYNSTNDIQYFSKIRDGISGAENGKTLYLVNTRILESDIEARLWYTPVGGTTPLPKNVTIVGDASGETVISAGLAGRVFYITAPASTGGKGGTLTLKNLTVADGSYGTHHNPALPPALPDPVDGRGGAIYVSGAQLVLDGASVINSYALKDGGAIYIGTQFGSIDGDKIADVVGTFTATSSFLGYNFAGNNGGAISSEGAVTSSSSTFYANTAGLGGGAIAITGGENVALTSTTIAYNRAINGLSGGILFNSLEAKSTMTTANNLLVRNMNSLSYDRDAIISSINIEIGAVPPPETLIGQLGDYYLDTATSDWYSFDGKAWVVSANIFTAYANVLAGDIVPGDTTGNNGDYYVQQQSGNNIVYFKDAGVWDRIYVLGASEVITGSGAPKDTNDNLGKDYVDLTNGDVYYGLVSGWDAAPSWSIKGSTHTMLTGTDAPVDPLINPPSAGGIYYMNTNTGELYVSEVGENGINLGKWSQVITTMKSSSAVTAGMDYYFVAGKLADTGYNMVEYQNGVWSKDTPGFFGEITWNDKDPKIIATNKHDILANHGTSPYPPPPAGADPITEYYDFGNIFLTGIASDNGGWSKTLAISGNGLAVDTGTGVTVDQRGYSINSASDIGAFEYDGFVAATGGINYTSVRNAVNAAADGATITLNATRILESNIAVNKNLTFTGTSGKTYLSGGYEGRVIDAEVSGSSLTFNTMTIGAGVALDSNVRQGAGAVGNGGAIFSNGSVTMADVQLLDSFAQRSGGGVYTVGGFSVTTTGNFDFQTIFSGNSANESGGAVFSNGNMNVKGVKYEGTYSRYINSLVQFDNNSAGQGGGALGVAGVATMQFFYLGENWADQGGGLYLTTGAAAGTSMIQDFAIESNFAMLGGGMYVSNYSSNIEVHDNYDTYASGFDSNQAMLDGGGIYFTNSANLLLTGVPGNPTSRVLVQDNIAGGSGGGIFFNVSKNLTLGDYAYVDRNTAGYDGGGIYFANSGQLITVFSNSANNNIAGHYGGGIYMLNSDKLITANHLRLNSNTATDRGGALYLNNVKEVDLYYTNIISNTAYESGAGMYLENVGKVTMGDVDLSHSQESEGIYAIGASNITIKTSNVSHSAGTGIWVEKGNLTLENVTVFHNGSASSDIGGIYLGNGNLNMKFSTVYMNSGVVGSLLIGDTATALIPATVSITDSIIFGGSFNNDVSFGNVKINSSTRNILGAYYTYLNASGLASGSYKTIYDGTGTVAGAVDGSKSIVGYNSSVASDIRTNFTKYFDNIDRYHANYRTEAVAITSLNSVAYGYYTGPNRTGFTRAGAADAAVTTDQRGNARNGYYYDAKYFDKATNTYGRYVLNSAPSIGAFEPIFSLTVNNKGDMTYDPFNTITISGLAANAKFADALAENNGTLNLRLASYWIDNYMVATQDFNPDRYIKFDGNVFTHTGDNTIKLNAGAGSLEIRTSQIIGMVPNYNGLSFTPDTTSFMAQNSTARITLDAQGTNRVVTVLNNFNSDLTVGINNLTLINGSSNNNANEYYWGWGGGIYNDSTLTLNNIVINNSKASNSNIIGGSNYGLGGGIFNDSGAVLVINDSSITNNIAEGLRIDIPNYVGLGGGIFNNDGTITINRSLIAGNIAAGFAIDLATEAGIRAGLGGGIFNYSGTLLVENSTITNNTLNVSSQYTGSAIYVDFGDVTLYNNTIVNNSLPVAAMSSGYSATAAAVYLGSGSFTLQNNIFALNNANGAAGFRGRDIYYNGASISESYNIIGYYSGAYSFNGTGDIIGDSFGNVRNLNLDSTLRYNGGMTMNFRVQAGSVAINAGNKVADLNYDQHDQRGAPRPASSPTIGAYEMLTSVEINTSVDTDIDYADPNVDYDFTTYDSVAKAYKITNYGGWQTSLRNALFLADGGATVTINPSTDPKIWDAKNTIKLIYGQMQIGTSLTLFAPVLFGGKPISIDGGWDGKSATAGSRIFWIDSLSPGLIDVTIQNLVLQNGSSRADSLGGGAINNSENLTLENVTIKNSVSDNGGAIYSTQGRLSLTGSTVISGNTALNNGGGIYVNAGSLNLIGDQSGDLYNFVKIIDNQAAGLGGGIYASNAAVTMHLAEISLTPTIKTTATPIYGGGMYLTGSTLNMQQSVIANNKSSYDGAGIYQINGSTYIETSTINSNTAGRYGGGIYAAVSNFELVNSTISGNKSGAFGGGIYYSSNGNLSLTYTTIANNISGTAKNAVEISGGGIYQADGTVQMINSIVAQNYHLAILSANHDDFYMASGSESSISSATYSIMGQSNIDFSQGAGMIVLGTLGNTGYNWNDLRLSTIVEDNGGPTQTLFIFSGSVAIGNGVDIPSIPVDQRGVTRQLPPTIGAYEKNLAEYIYIGGPGGDVNILANWQDSSFRNPSSFNQADALFVYNTTVTISSNWTLGSKAGSEVRTGGDVTVAGGVLVTATMNLTGTGTMSVGGKFSGSMFVAGNSTLELATADANITGMVLSVNSNSSTVAYSYTGSQTVFTAIYGNLSLSGGLPGTNKTAHASITVNGDLTMNNVLFATPSTDSLTVLGNVTGNGNISSGSVMLGSATSTIALTGNILANGTFGDIDIYGSRVNIAGDLTSLNGSIVIYSQNDAVLDGDLSASNGAISISALNMSYSNGTMSSNAISLFNTDSVLRNAQFVASSITVNGDISTSGNSTTSSFLTSNMVFNNLVNTITVNNGDTLYFNVGLQDVLMDNGSGAGTPGDIHFNVQNMTVASTGRFKVVTGSNLVLENVTGTEADNIKGILSLTSPTLNLSQVANLNFNYAFFEFGGNIQIGPNAFTIFNGIDFIGNVTLNGAAGSTVKVTSTNSYVKFTGSVFATGQNLNVSANTGIAFNNITGINDLTASSTIGVITLNGNIMVSGNAGFLNDVVVTGVNTSLTADNMNFNGSLTGPGNLTLAGTDGVQSTVSGIVNMGGALTLNSGFFKMLNDVTTGGLTIREAVAELDLGLIVNGDLNNAGKLLVIDDLHVRGNLTNTRIMTNRSNLVFDGASLQNLILDGYTRLENVVLNNASGAKLVSGNMTVLNDFTFQAGKFNLGNNIVEIQNALIGGGMDNYFVAGSKGLLKLMVRSTAAPTDFWIGNADYASKVSIQTAGPDTMFGVSTFNGVPGNGVPGGSIIYGINSAVKRTWVISSTSQQNYDIVFAWNKAEEGSALGDLAVLSNYQGSSWKAVSGSPINDGGAMRSTGMMALSVTGTMSVAAPGTSYDYPGAFHGLNNTSENLNFGPPPSMVVDVPPSMGLYSFEQMQLRLANSPLGNPLNVMIPATGTDIGGEYANETLTITSGTSVYGTPDGETEVDTEWTAPVEEREEKTIEEELDRQLENFFTELADSGNLEKHPAFKSEVDILLDKLMAS